MFIGLPSNQIVDQVEVGVTRGSLEEKMRAQGFILFLWREKL